MKKNLLKISQKMEKVRVLARLKPVVAFEDK